MLGKIGCAKLLISVCIAAKVVNLELAADHLLTSFSVLYHLSPCSTTFISALSRLSIRGPFVHIFKSIVVSNQINQ